MLGAWQPGTQPGPHARQPAIKEDAQIERCAAEGAPRPVPSIFRAEKKGVEPESVEVGTFHGKKLVFIGAERANAVGVYDISDIENPKLNQILSTGIGPEGLLAIEKRNLFSSNKTFSANFL